MKSFTDALSLLLIVMLTCFHLFPEKVGKNYGDLMYSLGQGFQQSAYYSNRRVVHIKDPP